MALVCVLIGIWISANPSCMPPLERCEYRDVAQECTVDETDR